MKPSMHGVDLDVVHVKPDDLLEWSEVGTEESCRGNVQEIEPRRWESHSEKGRQFASSDCELLIVPTITHLTAPQARTLPS
jgi:hypothetical protein